MPSYKHTRRDFLQTVGVAASAGSLGLLAADSAAQPTPNAPTGPSSSQTDQYTRKSATDMTPVEIARFKKAFQLVIDKGIMSQFATEHYDFMRHWHHGALLATQSVTATIAPEPAVSRFLPWHRAFMIELENAMQEALQEIGDPNYGEVFLPYWDWAHMDDMPAWTKLEAWRPTGVTATAVEGLPKGNPGYGIQGKDYEVELVRWPGTIPMASTLPSAALVQRILEFEDYYDFTTHLDYMPTMMVEVSSDAANKLSSLIKASGSPGFMAPLVRSLQSGSVSREDGFPASQALMRLNKGIFQPKMVGGLPPKVTRELLDVSLQVFPVAPHGNCHLWAGGWNDDQTVRGTVTYFSELTVDVLFWMLHCEMDRILYTWEKNIGGKPELEQRDTMFQPWRYGYYYTLDTLTDLDGLQYDYDQLWTE